MITRALHSYSREFWKRVRLMRCDAARAERRLSLFVYGLAEYSFACGLAEAEYDFVCCLAEAE